VPDAGRRIIVIAVKKIILRLTGVLMD